MTSELQMDTLAQVYAILEGAPPQTIVDVPYFKSKGLKPPVRIGKAPMIGLSIYHALRHLVKIGKLDRLQLTRQEAKAVNLPDRYCTYVTKAANDSSTTSRSLQWSDLQNPPPI